MHKQLFYFVVLGSVLATSIAMGAVRDKGSDNIAMGAYVGSGFTILLGNGYEQIHDLGIYDRKLKYSGEGGVYFDYYFKPALGIEMGLGFMSKGIRYVDGDNSNMSRITYMELPLLLKLDIHNIRIAAGIAVWFALRGKTMQKNEIVTENTDWDEYEWGWIHRVNVGPKLYAGYAIPVGPLFIVPYVTFRMHMMNDMEGEQVVEDIPDAVEDELKMRFITVNFNCAVEFTF